MQVQPYAAAYTFPGTSLPKVWNQPDRGRWFGDLVIVAFLLAQCFDGVFTYVGVRTFGMAVEANPIITSLMTSFGVGPGLTGAKVVAAALGICLHLRQVHGPVALLSLFYMAAAIVPWSVILFF
jgi:hypothetical protein